jgi:hypothetical protein
MLIPRAFAVRGPSRSLLWPRGSLTCQKTWEHAHMGRSLRVHPGSQAALPPRNAAVCSWGLRPTSRGQGAEGRQPALSKGRLPKPAAGRGFQVPAQPRLWRWGIATGVERPTKSRRLEARAAARGIEMRFHHKTTERETHLLLRSFVSLKVLAEGDLFDGAVKRGV